MDESIIETLKLANKAIDQTNALNKHIITCVTIILCAAFLCVTFASSYQSCLIYGYEFSTKNENVNENSNENTNKGE